MSSGLGPCGFGGRHVVELECQEDFLPPFGLRLGLHLRLDVRQDQPGFGIVMRMAVDAVGGEEGRDVGLKAWLRRLQAHTRQTCEIRQQQRMH